MHDLKQKHVNSAENVKVFPLGCLTLPETFMTCVLEDDLLSFMTTDQTVQQYGQTFADPIFPFVNTHLPLETELCVALVKGIWCRCVFLKLLGTSKKATVYAVDYGVITTVEIDDVLVSRKKKKNTKVLSNVWSIFISFTANVPLYC